MKTRHELFKKVDGRYYCYINLKLDYKSLGEILSIVDLKDQSKITDRKIRLMTDIKNIDKICYIDKLILDIECNEIISHEIDYIKRQNVDFAVKHLCPNNEHEKSVARNMIKIIKTV